MNHYLPNVRRTSVALAALVLLLTVGFATAESYHAYFGTYTGPKSKGIYVARFDATTGQLGQPELAAETPSPSFLSADPKQRNLYAVNEISRYEGRAAGSVSAFTVDRKTGRLTVLNVQSSGGGAPCHLVVDGKGRNVLVANYAGGSVAALPIGRNGALEPATSFLQHRGSSVNKSRQEAPHAHGIYVDAASRFAFVPDLGLDQVLIYRFDSKKGLLTANEPPHASVTPGSGPRHFALHPNRPFAYVINEMTCTLTAFEWNKKTGAMKTLETVSTLPPGEAFKPGFSTAELLFHPSGQFLYGSNRGHDTIAVYAVDSATGRPAHVENVPTLGKTPRSFGIDPSGRWLLAANQSSDTVAVFRIDQKSGRITPTGQSISVGSPVAVSFVEAR